MLMCHHDAQENGVFADKQKNAQHNVQWMVGILRLREAFF